MHRNITKAPQYCSRKACRGKSKSQPKSAQNYSRYADYQDSERKSRMSYGSDSTETSESDQCEYSKNSKIEDHRDYDGKAITIQIVNSRKKRSQRRKFCPSGHSRASCSSHRDASCSKRVCCKRTANNKNCYNSFIDETSDCGENITKNKLHIGRKIGQVIRDVFENICKRYPEPCESDEICNIDYQSKCEKNNVHWDDFQEELDQQNRREDSESSYEQYRCIRIIKGRSKRGESRKQLKSRCNYLQPHEYHSETSRRISHRGDISEQNESLYSQPPKSKRKRSSSRYKPKSKEKQRLTPNHNQKPLPDSKGQEKCSAHYHCPKYKRVATNTSVDGTKIIPSDTRINRTHYHCPQYKTVATSMSVNESLGQLDTQKQINEENIVYITNNPVNIPDRSTIYCHCPQYFENLVYDPPINPYNIPDKMEPEKSNCSYRCVKCPDGTCRCCCISKGRSKSCDIKKASKDMDAYLRESLSDEGLKKEVKEEAHDKDEKNNDKTEYPAEDDVNKINKDKKPAENNANKEDENPEENTDKKNGKKKDKKNKKDKKDKKKKEKKGKEKKKKKGDEKEEPNDERKETGQVLSLYRLRTVDSDGNEKETVVENILPQESNVEEDIVFRNIRDIAPKIYEDQIVIKRKRAPFRRLRENPPREQDPPLMINSNPPGESTNLETSIPNIMRGKSKPSNANQTFSIHYLATEDKGKIISEKACAAYAKGVGISNPENNKSHKMNDFLKELQLVMKIKESRKVSTDISGELLDQKELNCSYQAQTNIHCKNNSEYDDMRNGIIEVNELADSPTKQDVKHTKTEPGFVQDVINAVLESYKGFMDTDDKQFNR